MGAHRFECTCGIALANGQRCIEPDVAKSRVMAGTPIRRRISRRASVPCSPRRCSRAAGKLVGMISTHWKQPHQPSERDLRLLDVLARQAADLIDRKKAEEALREADRRKDEYLAMLAHELRNPLAAIGNASGPAATRRRREQRPIGDEILDRQVEAHGPASRRPPGCRPHQRGKIELRKRRSELAPIVSHAVEAIRPFCETLRHELTISLPRDPVYLDGDPTRLTQVVVNLLSNACKFTDQGGRIWLTVEHADGQAVIRVRDTGIGISADQLPRIFEIFAQGDSSLERQRDGLGLGLAVATKLVEMHDGTLEGRSAGPGLGPATGRAPGTQIGPYKLLQQIGEGGMGVVYMAEQSRPVQRKVALKIIKPGMDSRQVIARFEAERQALALMDHANIARVFDGGTTENGRPYFVMELVNGVPITKYCDDNHLTLRERLELFVPVCQAIQHAHQKGIIHRDIKPSNVMVTLYDGKPVPKVIDFGVAKATEQKLTERTLFTQYGTMVGTLEYMSPEQAEMSQLWASIPAATSIRWACCCTSC